MIRNCFECYFLFLLLTRDSQVDSVAGMAASCHTAGSRHMQVVSPSPLLRAFGVPRTLISVSFVLDGDFSQSAPFLAYKILLSTSQTSTPHRHRKRCPPATTQRIQRRPVLYSAPMLQCSLFYYYCYYYCLCTGKLLFLQRSDKVNKSAKGRQAPGRLPQHRSCLCIRHMVAISRPSPTRT